MTQFINKTTAIQETIQRRKLRVAASQLPPAIKERYIAELDNGTIPTARFPEGFDFNRVIRPVRSGGVIAEFIGTDTLGADFYERQRYEVDAGRDNEPLLYQPIYDVVNDPNLPRLIKVQTMKKFGVVFERVEEGGEVTFASVSDSNKSIEIYHYAAGLEYSEEMFLYNEMWRLAQLERQFGIASNALLNHIHLDPIISYTYTGNNLTDGTALTTFKTSASMAEKYLRALESAVTTATTDKTNPRRGRYVLLCASGDDFTFERALRSVPQQGFDAQSSVTSRISQVIAYDGWTGLRGKKETSYSGVPAGTAFLIDVANRNIDFQSFVKQDMRVQRRDGDLKRFILETVIYDMRFGTYASPVAAVQKITLPTAASGSA